MAESKKNYYEILGVSKTASADEIKSAYRKLAKQYHPDLHPGDAVAAEKFKEINEANETLSDAQKRKQYDFELEHPGMGSGGFGGFRASAAATARASADSKIFSAAFSAADFRASAAETARAERRSRKWAKIFRKR